MYREIALYRHKPGSFRDIIENVIQQFIKYEIFNEFVYSLMFVWDE